MGKNINDSNRRNAVCDWAFNAGLLLVLIGTALPLLKVDSAAGSYLFCIGAVCAFLGRIFRKADKTLPLRARRLMRMEVWATVVFCVGGVFRLFPQWGYGANDWLAFALAGGVLIVYATLMLPRAVRK
ncbi:MAG: hypothetical protein K2M94_01975 [Paramuribaculum sp.]|nr:hypothetical protein [Paramuribaculum sp.]